MGLRGRHLGRGDQRDSCLHERGNVRGSSYGNGPRNGCVRCGHCGRNGHERAPGRGRGPTVPYGLGGRCRHVRRTRQHGHAERPDGPRLRLGLRGREPGRGRRHHPCVRDRRDAPAPHRPRHSVALRVTDDEGAFTTTTTIVTVMNVPPRVGITGVWWFSNKILFEGTAFDPGADDLTFIWKVGGLSGSEWYRSTSFANGLHPREQVAYASYPTGPRVNALLPLTFPLVVNDDEGAGGFDTVTLVLGKASPLPSPSCAIPPDVATQCALPPRDDRLVDGLAPRFDAGPDVTVSEEVAAPIFAPLSFADSSSSSWTLVWEWGDGSVTQLNGVVDPVHTYVEHPFVKAGTYTVALTIIGNGGLTVDGFLATALNVAPPADFSFPSNPQKAGPPDVSGAPSADTPSATGD